MKYIIAALVISTSALASEPKKIHIPRQESKSVRITLKRSGLSIREALNEMASININDFQAMKVMERAQAEMKKIERAKKNQATRDALEELRK